MKGTRMPRMQQKKKKVGVEAEGRAGVLSPQIASKLPIPFAVCVCINVCTRWLSLNAFLFSFWLACMHSFHVLPFGDLLYYYCFLLVGVHFFFFSCSWLSIYIYFLA